MAECETFADSEFKNPNFVQNIFKSYIRFQNAKSEFKKILYTIIDPTRYNFSYEKDVSYFDDGTLQIRYCPLEIVITTWDLEKIGEIGFNELLISYGPNNVNNSNFIIDQYVSKQQWITDELFWGYEYEYEDKISDYTFYRAKTLQEYYDVEIFFDYDDFKLIPEKYGIIFRKCKGEFPFEIIQELLFKGFEKVSLEYSDDCKLSWNRDNLF